MDIQRVKDFADIAKNVTGALALLCGFVFFAYKAIAGYLFVDLTLAVTTRRTASHSGGDHLVIMAILKKGARGSVRIHDAQARVTWDGGREEVRFVGIHRQSYDIDTENRQRKIISWDRRSVKQPLLRLPPDEQAEFSCHLPVPSGVVCEIEVTVLGRERPWFGVGQWKASHISTPNA